MPELPEVQTVVDSLRPHVLGCRIAAVNLRRPDVFEPVGFDVQLLVGQTFIAVNRRGKRIIFTLSGGGSLVVHLGMTGRLTIEPREADLQPHTHLVAHLSEAEMRFIDARRFGGIRWIDAGLSPDDRLGPEPLGLRSVTFSRQLAGTTRAIKNTLLDQTVIAGLGNIYVDEALHAAGIHPLSRTHELSTERVDRLNRAIKQTLRKAIRHRGSTLRDYRDADGNSGEFQKLHRVYGRGGLPCRKCKSTIERVVLGGRSTHFCPNCQK